MPFKFSDRYFVFAIWKYETKGGFSDCICSFQAIAPAVTLARTTYIQYLDVERMVDVAHRTINPQGPVVPIGFEVYIFDRVDGLKLDHEGYPITEQEVTR